MQSGFTALGWVVRAHIAGDHLTRAATSEEATLRGSYARRLAQDLVRLAANAPNTAATRRFRSADLIYERFATLQSLGRYHRRRLGAPWVVESNGLFYEEAGKDRHALALTRTARIVELRTYESADVVVAVSEVLRQRLLAASTVLAKAPHRVVVVPNGIDAVASRRTVPSNGAEVRIVFAGTLIEWQGLPSLIAAAALLQDNLGTRLRIRIVGDGPDRSRLERLVRESSLEHAIEFVGRVPPEVVSQHLAWAHIGFSGHSAVGAVYHSPLKLYEYAAAGLRIISTETHDARMLASLGYPVEILGRGRSEAEAVAGSIIDTHTKPMPVPDSVIERVLEECSWKRRAEAVVQAVGDVMT